MRFFQLGLNRAWGFRDKSVNFLGTPMDFGNSLFFYVLDMGWGPNMSDLDMTDVCLL